jgi:hypothetical protein
VLGVVAALGHFDSTADRPIPGAVPRPAEKRDATPPPTPTGPAAAADPVSQTRVFPVQAETLPLALPRTRGPGLDAVVLANQMIDRLSRDEILESLSEMTGRDPEEIDAIDDLHEFARSLAKALLSNELPVAEPESPIQPIRFSRRLGLEAPTEPGATVLPASSHRIFGSFPLEPGDDLQVVAKWYQVDPPLFLMLEEVPVREQNGLGFVRIDRNDGWPAGLYRLELYASNESVEPIAAGEYRTQGETAPLVAVFD